MEYVQFLHLLADAASEAILPHFRTQTTVDNKEDKRFDPVTVADKAAEWAMRELINKHYPDHGIFGEEYGKENEDADNVWILDPIDGTRAFISGVPTWGTLIGLKTAGKASFGMMSQAFSEERFFGDGKSAHYQKAGNTRSIKTRICKSLSEATLFTTSPRFFSPEAYPHYEAVESEVRLSSFGIDCYAYCMLALGHVDLVIEDGLKAYDVAGLIPIIEGAGGKITNWRGENAVEGGSIVAAGDPALHEIVLERLNQ